jgi:hypothetical protein
LVEAVEAQIGLYPKVLTDPPTLKPRFTLAGAPPVLV